MPSEISNSWCQIMIIMITCSNFTFKPFHKSRNSKWCFYFWGIYILYYSLKLFINLRGITPIIYSKLTVILLWLSMSIFVKVCYVRISHICCKLLLLYLHGFDTTKPKLAWFRTHLFASPWKRIVGSKPSFRSI